MNKIKIVYEWIGPNGPLSNNRVPNIFDIANVTSGLNVTDQSQNNSVYLYNSLFSRHPKVFELSSTYGLNGEDLFVYDWQIHYRTHFRDLFSYGAKTGLIESSHISPIIMDKIRNEYSNGFLLIDCSLESFVDNTTFWLMHNYFDMHGIPLEKIIYQTGCPNVQELYDHYCSLMKFPKKMKMLFWDAFEHQMSEREQNKNYETHRHIEIINKTFLCLNYRYRQHRLDLLLLFYKFGLLDDTYFSMPAHNPHNRNELYMKHIDKNFLKNLNMTDQDLVQLQSMLPLKVDDLADNHGSHGELTMDNKHGLTRMYETSIINITTETTAYSNIIAETEKTFKPTLYKQPFILAGAPYSIKYLKNKGYKTFSDWFDEGYDNIEDHRTRMFRITEICKEISEWTKDQKSLFIEETKPILNYNYDLLKSVCTDRLPDRWDLLRKGEW